MEILPAIDLYEGKAVRLLRGEYAQMTVYNDDPVAVAKRFRSAGAKWVHMVDLEGAKSGETPNLPMIRRVAGEAGLLVEAGGGLRDMDAVSRCLDAGVTRAILGTAALTDVTLLRGAVSKYGSRIAVGADIRDGCVAIKGWTETSRIRCEDFLERLCDVGVSTVICTDISRDGALTGPNRALYEGLCRRFAIRIVASGGVTTIDDVRALRDMGLWGAIIGKAYYTGAIDLREAIEVSA